MIELIVLFVLLLLTLLARYLVYGAFEPLALAVICLMPLASLAIFLISKRLADKESAYQPKNIDGWSFYHIQKSLMNKKPLFNGNEQKGYIKRYFPERWKYAFADVFGFNWYLSLEIQIEQNIYDVRWYRIKWLTQQDQWKIYKNGEQIGTARTLINFKNSAKLKESIEYIFADIAYITSASTVTSAISLTHNEKLLGTLKRKHAISGVQVIDLQEESPEYIVALIVHSYFFKNK